MTAAQRFWAKVDRSAGPKGCWLWTAATRRTGYGCMKYGAKIVDAHRIAYEIAHKAIPLPGLCVTHRCDNRLCVNPAHLVLGTKRDNHDDMVSRGRRVSGEAIAERNRRMGYKPPRTTKLTDDDVVRIREMLASGYGHGEIAGEFGVSRSAITKIASGRTWNAAPSNAQEPRTA